MKKIALIGCGGIGGYHLHNLAKFKDKIELVGFCDVIPERAEGFVKQTGQGKAYGADFKKMYDEAKPDMLFVGTPPYAHGDIEFEAIERGIHLFVQKPVALDMELAVKIRDKIAEKGLVSASGFQCRYSSINEAAKNYIAQNEIISIQASRIGGVPEVDWWRVKDLSGGQLAEQTVHQVDILRYLFGDMESVYSIATRGFVKESEWPGYNTDDATTTVFKFKSGLAATMITGCYSLNGASWDSKMTFGSRSSRLDYHLISHVDIFGIDEQDKAAEIAGVVKGDGMQKRNENEQGIRVKASGDYDKECFGAFIDAVISGKPEDAKKIKSPYCDAVKSLAAVLGANESMKTGQVVKINI
jgi:predicted dehydrogenase